MLRPFPHFGGDCKVGMSVDHSYLPLPHHFSTVSSSSLSSIASFTALSGSLTALVKASLDWSLLKYSFPPVKSGSRHQSMWHPVLEQSGHQLTPRLVSRLLLDWRDCSLLPSKGLYMRLEHQLATGPGKSTSNQVTTCPQVYDDFSDMLF